jgi:hypothetical protein
MRHDARPRPHKPAAPDFAAALRLAAKKARRPGVRRWLRLMSEAAGNRQEQPSGK